MITIPEVVERLVKRNPYLEEALYDGLINFSALARYLKPEIQKQTMKTVEDGAILMALRRFSEKEKTFKVNLNVFKGNPDIIIRSQLFEYTIEKPSQFHQRYKDLLDELDKERSYFFTISQGVFETTIIASKELEGKIRKSFRKEQLIMYIDNLSSLTIKLPADTLTTPSVYYFIIKSLAWEGINIIEVVSTYTELTIILNDKDIDHAFSVLKHVLSSRN